MARIAGVDLPPKKRAEIGLTYIYGIGRTRAKSLCHRTGIDPNKKIGDLTEEEVNQKLQKLMLRAFNQVTQLASLRKLSMRTAALSLGVEKIAREKMRRGLYP